MPIKTLTCVKYVHIFPPLDTTTLLVAMLVQNTELNKNTLLLNCERFYYILNERGVYGDRLAACINDSIAKSKTS